MKWRKEECYFAEIISDRIDWIWWYRGTYNEACLTFHGPNVHLPSRQFYKGSFKIDVTQILTFSVPSLLYIGYFCYILKLGITKVLTPSALNAWHHLWMLSKTIWFVLFQKCDISNIVLWLQLNLLCFNVLLCSK